MQTKNLSGVAFVAAGATHAMAVKSDGTVWAWGSNERGQRGNGDAYDLYTPKQVLGLSGGLKLAAGELHSMMVGSDGTGWAWGFNDDGQLGNGNPLYIPLPIQSLLN
ncbi:RCC1 domain-containing protein [Hyalangium rubrum]|uniref:RCC1 domain-containing protein n=1 Tax=Hyalangium rubrum TaxID=3103134 RepID=UPI003BF4D281